MIATTRTDFQTHIKQGVCVVEVSAPWCPDCRKIEPILKNLEEQYSDVRFILLDFDSNEELRNELGIRRIPTLIFYKNGEEVLERLVEPDNKLPIENSIKSLLDS